MDKTLEQLILEELVNKAINDFSVIYQISPDKSNKLFDEVFSNHINPVFGDETNEPEEKETITLIVKFDHTYNCLLVSFGDEIIFNGGSRNVYDETYGEVVNDIFYCLEKIAGVYGVGGISNEMRFYLVKSDIPEMVFPRILAAVERAWNVNVNVKQKGSLRPDGNLSYVSLGADVEYEPI